MLDFLCSIAALTFFLINMPGILAIAFPFRYLTTEHSPAIMATGVILLIIVDVLMAVTTYKNPGYIPKR